jgi:hypothetical protein
MSDDTASRIERQQKIHEEFERRRAAIIERYQRQWVEKSDSADDEGMERRRTYLRERYRKWRVRTGQESKNSTEK